ncbi:hypothetical protein LIER_22039 [Lithospermum erythrorhizon]|uniref:Uncharacterized protein n=1 Tax=Lithospermum erythrorhizon TaxID=34254 RepID=A0AAV3QUV4_LITER
MSSTEIQEFFIGTSLDATPNEFQRAHGIMMLFVVLTDAIFQATLHWIVLLQEFSGSNPFGRIFPHIMSFNIDQDLEDYQIAD